MSILMSTVCHFNESTISRGHVPFLTATSLRANLGILYKISPDLQIDNLGAHFLFVEHIVQKYSKFKYPAMSYIMMNI